MIRYGRGTYYLSDPIVLTEHGDSITGAGIEATRLVYTGTGPAIRNVAPDAIHWGVTVGGLTLEGGGIALDSTYRARVEDVLIRRSAGAGVRLYRSISTRAYAAYNTLDGVCVDGSAGSGNGIVLDAGSECNELRGCNASYFQDGAIPSGYADEETDCSAGVGLLIASGNNTITGGHLDRCTYPLWLQWADSNSLDTATDNALGRAVVLRGARQTTGRIAVGRCDPTLPDGTLNPRYGLANWAAVHATNVSAGNRLELRFRPDTSPPPLPVGRSSWPRGGWDVAVWENGGTGQAANGGANRWAVLPEGQLKYRLDGLGVILR